MAQPLPADIGDISELNGLAQIVRDAKVNTAALKLGNVFGDAIKSLKTFLLYVEFLSITKG